MQEINLAELAELVDSDWQDEALAGDDPDPKAMEQQFAYEKGILALYKTPWDCPHWANVARAGVVACGRILPGAFTTWGALRPVWR